MAKAKMLQQRERVIVSPGANESLAELDDQRFRGVWVTDLVFDLPQLKNSFSSYTMRFLK
jgi:hypothetical protein